MLHLGPSGAPHEATLLNLSIAKASRLLDWKPKWAFEEKRSQRQLPGMHGFMPEPPPRLKSADPKQPNIRVDKAV